MIFSYAGIQGFDVSFYQDDNKTPQKIDFRKMKAWGASFVVIRAGQGLWVDEDFQDNWRNAREAGLPRASYFFYDPRVSPQTQALLFTSLFSNDKPEGRLWADFEFPASWGGSFSGWQNWRTFLDNIKPKYRTGIYTADWWWRPNAVQKGADLAYFKQYPLWNATYNNNPANVILPAPWTRCILWQDGTPPVGIAAGVESKEIDHDKWNSEFDFNLEWGIQQPPPPPGGSMDFYEVLSVTPAETRSLRADHIITASHIDDLPPSGIAKAFIDIFTYTGDLYVSGILRANTGDQWVHVFDINGRTVNGWMAVIHLKKVYTSLKLIVPPPPVNSLEFDITASSPGYQAQTTKIILPPA